MISENNPVMTDIKAVITAIDYHFLIIDVCKCQQEIHPRNYVVTLAKIKWSRFGQEYVASLIGLYKNNGAVSCVGIYFLLIHHRTHTHPDFTQILS